MASHSLLASSIHDNNNAIPSDSGAGLDDEDKAYLPDGEIGRRLKHYNPSKPMLLGKFDVILIIANRMIGSGIFLTPSTLMKLTQSVGISMLFWLAGACTTLCGALMFMEYGLTSPRFNVDGAQFATKIPIPRSGGDLFYLKDIIRKPKFFAVCLYGIAFVLLGNIATNSMAFGVRVLEAAGRIDPSNGTVDAWLARGIALIIVTFTCALHSTWRLGGIYISNLFAIVKIAMLLMIFITGCLAWGGVFPRDGEAVSNMTSTDAFKEPSTDAYAFAEAYLSIVFAYGGFQQANYILGEVDQPKKNYKWPAFFSVLGVSILYLLVNIAYMLVVPAEDMKRGVDVATRFFELTYGSISSNEKLAPRILSAFMAVSALGNLMVMTYTAARVKQEIAKEGILPFPKFFANNKVVFGNTGNPIPFGALVLHWAVSVLLIICTARLAPKTAYGILVGLYSYTIDAIFGVILAVGILILRFRRSRSFAENSFLSGWISIGVAMIYGASLAFPLITSWVPPSAGFLEKFKPNVPWFASATVSVCCVALGALWWVGFTRIYPLMHPGKQLVVRRTIMINEDMVMDHEILEFDWHPKEDEASSMSEDAHVGFADVGHF